MKILEFLETLDYLESLETLENQETSKKEKRLLRLTLTLTLTLNLTDLYKKRGAFSYSALKKNIRFNVRTFALPLQSKGLPYGYFLVYL